MSQIRITGFSTQPASAFLANPDNHRIHPQRQRKALRKVLDKVGWVQTVIVNTITGHLVDGHERVWAALDNGDEDVPFVTVELSPEEERIVLASFDTISSMALIDTDKADTLLREMVNSDAEMEMFAKVLADELALTATPPEKDNASDAPEKCTCPTCGKEH